MNVLVTGGAGYIGSVVARELVKAGHKVVVYDNLSHGYRAAVPKEAAFVQGEVGDARAVTEVLRKHQIEAVMHFAALIEVGESMRVPERYFQNNTGATLTLLEAMVANGVSKFVFSSTAALYGEPEHTPIPESAALRPANAYGESKLLVERMLDWLNRIHGFRYASLRYFNAAGARRGIGRGARTGVPPDPIGAAGAAGEETVSLNFWIGLSHARWNLCARLRSCTRSGAGASSGSARRWGNRQSSSSTLGVGTVSACARSSKRRAGLRGMRSRRLNRHGAREIRRYWWRARRRYGQS